MLFASTYLALNCRKYICNKHRKTFLKYYTVHAIYAKYEINISINIYVFIVYEVAKYPESALDENCDVTPWETGARRVSKYVNILFSFRKLFYFRNDLAERQKHIFRGPGGQNSQIIRDSITALKYSQQTHAIKSIQIICTYFQVGSGPLFRLFINKWHFFSAYSICVSLFNTRLPKIWRRHKSLSLFLDLCCFGEAGKWAHG